MADITSNLEAHYPLNDNAADTVVTALVGVNGTLTNAGNTEDVYVGAGNGPAPPSITDWGFTFDGTNDHVDTTEVPVTDDAAVSISAWFKTTSLEGAVDNVLLEWGTGTQLSSWRVLIEDGDIWLRMYGSAASWQGAAAGQFNDDEWHHLVLTKPASGNLSDVKCYVDDTLLTRDSISSDGLIDMDAGSATGLHIGSEISGLNTFLGSIADVRIFERELNENEISSLFTLNNATVLLNNLNPTDTIFFQPFSFHPVW